MVGLPHRKVALQACRAACRVASAALLGHSPLCCRGVCRWTLAELLMAPTHTSTCGHELPRRSFLPAAHTHTHAHKKRTRTPNPGAPTHSSPNPFTPSPSSLPEPPRQKGIPRSCLTSAPSTAAARSPLAAPWSPATSHAPRSTTTWWGAGGGRRGGAGRRVGWQVGRQAERGAPAFIVHHGHCAPWAWVRPHPHPPPVPGPPQGVRALQSRAPLGRPLGPRPPIGCCP